MSESELMSEKLSIRAQILNKYVFYKDLCEELLRFARHAGVKVWMVRRKQNEVDFLKKRYDDIWALAIHAHTMRRMQMLAANITRFYERRYPLHAQSEMQDTRFLIIVNWRWQHLLERAQRWQEIAKKHDWEKADLQIAPRYPQYERWWANTPSPAVGLPPEDNAYVIVSP